QRAHVTFSAPQRGVPPGQSVVFYRGDVVLGGGVIARREVKGDLLPSVKKKL
ncbi:MAG: aminomethyltransferase beta-barrel domain-containing protein, partial [Chloroflexota bacterium]|nr:aminomethyltransferase beta-barrel domain-containing protein [Chloroflexota bacterium]